MPFDCTNANITIFNRTCTSDADYSRFRFTRGKTYRLRLMNIGSQGMQRFTIDGMKMKVFAQDFIPVVPYVTDVVTVGIGQRTDVLVTATGRSTDAIWMRSDVSPTCSVSTQGHAKAAIYYEKANTSVLPNSTATVYDDSFCGNVCAYSERCCVLFSPVRDWLTLFSGTTLRDNAIVSNGSPTRAGNNHLTRHQVCRQLHG